jgi:hypothetical protein
LGVFVFAFLNFWSGPGIAPVIVFTAVGFFGVFSGTLGLPRSSRRVGSGVLLLLGLAFFCCMAKMLADAPDDGEESRGIPMSPFVWCIPLMSGGLLAAFLFWWPPRKKSLQPTIHAPVGSEPFFNWKFLSKVATVCEPGLSSVVRRHEHNNPMKKCSYCGAEYPDDAVMCTVDHTPFASPAEPPPPPKPGGPQYRFPPLSAADMQKDFVTLVRCPSLPAADLIMGRLEAAGIEALMPDESVMQAMCGDLNGFGYVRIQIAPKDYEAAKELLSDIYDAA